MIEPHRGQGRTTVTTPTAAMRKEVTVDMSIDDFAAEDAVLSARLADEFGVHPSLFTLEVAPVKSGLDRGCLS